MTRFPPPVRPAAGRGKPLAPAAKRPPVIKRDK